MIFFKKNGYKEMLDEELIKVRPSQRQIAYMQDGYHGFIHFTVNTYTNSEWGDGTEDPSIFNPEELNTDEWAKTAKLGGMKGLILTCKHHDGFCLWPSRYTEHSIKNSPYKNGNGDIVKELSDSCRKYGLKFGIYLSPWDRNSKFYGYGKVYDDYYVNQLTELLTHYGDIFAVWLDGACGENSTGKKQAYDWNRYYDTVRMYQPNAVISICGPDIRWCGNEAGKSRKNEWSVVSRAMSNPDYIGENSQTEDDASFRGRPIDPTMEDLGSRDVLKNEKELIYYPSEVDVSIRPGWFYHTSEDKEVRSVDNLFEIYMRSVGHNACLLLNLPPMQDGRLHPKDVETMEAFGKRLKNSFSHSLKGQALISQFDKYEKNTVITAEWENPVNVNYIVIQEDITFSQRIEEYQIIGEDELENCIFVKKGTTIGFREIISVPDLKLKKIVFEVLDVRTRSIIKNFDVF